MRRLTRALLIANFCVPAILVDCLDFSPRRVFGRTKIRDSSYYYLLIAVLVYGFDYFVSGAFYLDSGFQDPKHGRAQRPKITRLGALLGWFFTLLRLFAYMLSCWDWQGERRRQTNQRSRVASAWIPKVSVPHTGCRPE